MSNLLNMESVSPFFVVSTWALPSPDHPDWIVCTMWDKNMTDCEGICVGDIIKVENLKSKRSKDGILEAVLL